MRGRTRRWAAGTFFARRIPFCGLSDGSPTVGKALAPKPTRRAGRPRAAAGEVLARGALRRAANGGLMLTRRLEGFHSAMQAGSGDLLGWNGPRTGYACADGTQVQVKRQETARFTKMEEAKEIYFSS